MRTVILSILLLLLSVSAVSSQGLTTRGREFFIAFGDNQFTGSSNGIDKLSVFISSRTNTSGTISAPLSNWTRNFTVTAGTPTEILVPISLAFTTDMSDRIEGKGVRVQTQDSVNVYALNYKQNSADASVVLPTQVLREDYMVMSYNESSASSGVGRSQFNIVALQDNTVIEIIPTADILQGNAQTSNNFRRAGVRYTITLNAFQVYQAQIIRTGDGDLTGTIVRSASNDCKPFSVFGGNVCSNVGGCGRCDHLFEQIFPIATWGNEYIFVPFRNRTTGDVMRVLASEDNTEVLFSDNTSFTLQAGRFRDFRYEVPVYIKSTKPIMISQYSVGGCCDAGLDANRCGGPQGTNVYGDPFMLLLSPLEQMTIKSTTVNSFDLANIDDSFINVITPTAAVGSFRLDGNIVPNAFQTIPGNTVYSYARFSVLKGDHTLTSSIGFIAYVYGFGTRDSYGYSGDVTLSNLRLVIKASETACTSIPVSFEGESTRRVTNWQWHTSDGQTQNGQEVSFSFARPGTYNVTLKVNDQTSNCGVDSSVHQIQVYGPALDVVSKQNPECSLNNGRIQLRASGGKPPYRFQMNNGTPTPNSTFSNIAAGTYTFRLLDQSDCRTELKVELKDTNKVEPVIEVNGKTSICRGDTTQLSVRIQNPTADILYQWLLNNRDIRGANNSIYVVTIPGSYTVKVIIGQCEVTSQPFAITEEEAPSDRLTATQPISDDGVVNLCVNETLNLSAASGDGYTYAWFRNDTPLNQTNRTIPVSTAGRYYADVAAGVCTTRSQTVTVNLVDLPNTAVTVDGNLALCPGGNVSFSLERQDNVTYQWTRNGSPIPGAVQPRFTAGNAGNYQLEARRNGCMARSDVFAVSVVSLQKPRIITQGNQTQFCEGNNVNLRVNPISGIRYDWYRDGVKINTESTTSITATTSGRYSARAILTGCESESDVVALTFLPNRATPISAPNPAIACIGSVVTLSTEILGDGRYVWSLNGNVETTTASSTINVNKTGNWTVLFQPMTADAGSCFAPSAAVSVEIRALPSNEIESNQSIVNSFVVQCSGTSVVLNSKVANAERYTWFRNNEVMTGETSRELKITESGNYALQVFDGICQSANTTNAEIIRVRIFPSPDVTISPARDTLELCAGRTETLSVPRGNPNTQYQWIRNGSLIPNQNGLQLEVMESGSYSVRAVLVHRANDQTGDSLICIEISKPVVVVAGRLQPVSISFTTSLIGCVGDSVRFSTAAQTGASYQWLINDQEIAGASQIQFNAKTYGLYKVRVSLGPCNVTSNAVPAIFRPRPQISNVSITPPICGGQQNGSVQIQVSGATAPYRYRWTNGNTTSDLQNVAAGTYGVTVTDNRGCSSSLDTIKITQPNPLSLKVDSTKASVCNNTNNGAIYLSATGGTEPYTFIWSNGNRGPALENATGGNYSVFMYDARNCVSIMNNIAIPFPEPIQPAISLLRNNKCFGETNGIVEFTAFGGTPPYQFSNDRQTWVETAKYHNLRGTQNIYFIRDAIGCVVEFDSKLRDPDSLYIKVYKTDETCENSSNANIVLEAKGGVAPYVYNLGNLRNYHGTYPFLSPGSYIAFVKDNNGCTFVADTLVVNPANGQQVQADFVAVGKAKLTEAGCAQLTEARSFENSAIWNRKLLNLNSGFDFSFDLNFGSGADGADGMVFVLQSLGTDALGASGQGLGYERMPNSFGIEFDIFSNANEPNCDHIAFNLNGNVTTPVAGPVDANPSNCNIEDGQDHLVRVVWNAKDRNIEVYLDGQLRLEQDIDLIGSAFRGNPNVWWGFTGATGGRTAEMNVCARSTAVVCDCVPFKPIVQTTGDYEICKGDSVVFTAPAGYASYLWSNGKTGRSISVKESDSYYVSVGDSTGCGGSSDISTVVVQPKPKLKIDRINQIFGDGFTGLIEASVTDGTPSYSFNLSSDQVNITQSNGRFTDLQGGNYTLIVTDLNGCTDVTGTEIKEPFIPCKNPNKLAVNQITETSADISWEKPKENATGYIVSYRLSTESFTREQTISNPDVTKITLFDLVPGGKYKVQIRTVCNKLYSFYSPDSAFQTPQSCPRPVGLTIVPSDTSIEVGWRKINDALNYKISWQQVGSSTGWFEATVDANNPKYTIKSLVPITEYNIRVRTVCRIDLASVWVGPEKVSTTDPNACFTPTDVKFSSLTNRRATLTWNAVPRAQQYEVSLRLKGSGNNAWNVTLTRETEMEWLDLQPNTLYEYRIRTMCSVVNYSEYLPIQEFKTEDKDCILPLELTVTTKMTTAHLKWKLEGTIRGFELSWRRIDQQGSWLKVSLNSGTLREFTISNLQPEASYEFRIQSRCNGSALSNFIQAIANTLPTSACPPPINIRAEQVGSNQIQLNWVSEPKAIRYRLAYGPVGSTSLQTQEISQNAFLLAGLQNMGQYQYFVQSICKDDLTSLPSATDTLRLVSGNCQTPVFTGIVSAQDQMGLNWTPVTGATGYRIEWRALGGAPAWKEGLVSNGQTGSYTINSLSAGSLYEVRLLSLCNGEFSAWNDTILNTQYNESSGGCMAPIQPSVSDLSDFEAKLQWAPVTSALYYEVRWRPSASQDWVIVTTENPSLVIRSLSPNRLYTYQIRTYCTEGRRSEYSISRNFKTSIQCPAPKNITILVGNQSVVISWDHVLQAVGYRVLWRPRFSNSSWDIAEIGSQTTNSIQLRRLLPATEYEFQVVSLCGALNSPTTEGRFTTLIQSNPDTCPLPEDVRVISTGRNTASISWNSVASAVDYEVQYRASNQTQWISEYVALPQFNMTTLQAATTYLYRVRTRCNGGALSALTSSQEFTTLGNCSTPTNVRIARSFSRQLVISWNLQLEATGYAISWREVGSFNNWITASINSSTTNSYTINSLKVNQAYEIRVQAICGIERSSWSTSINGLTLNSKMETAEALWEQTVNVYPNPNRGRFVVELPMMIHQEAKFQLFDLQGRSIKEWNDFGVQSVYEFDARDLPSGVYVLGIQTGFDISRHRLIIE